jgi:hypothetical protein
MRAFLLAATLLNWNNDLTHLATEVPKLHPNPWHVTSRETYVAEIETLRKRAPELAPHEVIVEMTRIVALLGDGHTRLTLPLDATAGFFQGHTKTAPPKLPELMFHTIPQRFVVEDEGLFTTDGRRVKRIGRRSAEEAVAAVLPVAHGDNEWHKREIVASYLAVPEVLHARGVIESLGDVPLELECEPDGLKPAAPLEPFAFRVQGHAVIFEYNEVANGKTETLAQFAARMFEVVETQPVNKLIIDLRNNFGGNNSLNRAVVHGIIRSRKLQQPGSLFVLVGRRTFSAATMLLTDLEQRTNAILIGEPTGGSPNGYGDSRKVILPDSGLTVRVSTLYWQKSDPRDKRTAFEPHVRSRDPLAVALDYFGGTPGTPAGSWKGVVTVEHERLPFALKDGKFSLEHPFTVRAGTKRLAGTMTANGMEFLVTGEREPQASMAAASARPSTKSASRKTPTKRDGGRTTPAGADERRTTIVSAHLSPSR